MAQTTKSTSKSATSRNGSKARSSGPRKTAASSRSTTKKTSSNGNRAKSSGSTRAKSTGSTRAKSSGSTRAKAAGSSRTKSTRTKSTATRPRSQSRPSAPSRNGAGSIKDTAIDGTKAAGSAVATALSKAKTPLIAGGTALVGIAAGAAIQGRMAASRSKNPLKRLRGVSMPKPAAKLDLGAVKSAAERVSAYGQQASDIAAAVEKTRKKNK